MKIFDVLKALKRNHYYNVPVNPLESKEKRSLVNHHHTGSHLVELRNMLVKHGYDVKFEMEDKKDVPIWDSDKKQMVFTPVVKINIEIKKQ